MKTESPAIISRLSPPWREKLILFSIVSQNILYMDQRFVIPKNMRENVSRATEFRCVVRDAMLRGASDVWWPLIHREIVEKTKNCADCQTAGKNIKCIRTNLQRTNRMTKSR